MEASGGAGTAEKMRGKPSSIRAQARASSWVIRPSASAAVTAAIAAGRSPGAATAGSASSTGCPRRVPRMRRLRTLAEWPAFSEGRPFDSLRSRDAIDRVALLKPISHSGETLVAELVPFYSSSTMLA